MPFYVASSDLNGLIVSGTITQLSPAPTWVDYPERFVNTVRFSKDGAPVVQAPLKDSRPRTWIWKRYRSSVPHFDTLYNLLLNYQYKLRQATGQSPWVYVRDTESGNLTFRTQNGNTFTENASWVRVKVIQVTKNLAQQGGPAVWEDTKFVWVIDDPTWNLF